MPAGRLHLFRNRSRARLQTTQMHPQRNESSNRNWTGPGADERDFRELLNPDSLKVLDNCYVEPYLKEKKSGDFLQFQRIGYFTLDLDSTAEHLVFNKTVGLKDTWKR